MSSTYLVNELYPCLQGEGPSLGLPSLLVRFQICNLRCTWCDTPYTHTIKSDKNFFRYTLQNLIEKIQTYPQKHLILTGGEPTLHNLGSLMRALQAIGPYTFEVESNATRIPHKQLPGFLESDYKLAQWNLSPKFSNSGEEIEPDALAHWSQLATRQEKIYFKFVVREQFVKTDMDEILKLINDFKIRPENVILMPEGTNVPSQLNNKWLHDECLKYGFRYTPRLHILLFGHLRGV